MATVNNYMVVGKKLSVVDNVFLLSPQDTPMINLLGFSQAATQVEHAWYEDALHGLKASAEEAAAADATSIVVDDVEPFRADQVIQAGSELLLVTAVNVAAKTLTVQRGFGGTSAAAIEAGDEIEVVSNIQAEGANARDARYKPRKRVYNVCQIFDDTISISGTQQATTSYGVDNEYMRELDKKIRELSIQLERALIRGQRVEGDINDTMRMMGGLDFFIKSNVYDNGGEAITAAVLEEKFNDQLQQIYNAGGFSGGGQYTAIMNGVQKRNFNQILKDQVRADISDNRRGVVVDTYVSDFGVIEIALNRHVPNGVIYIVDRNRAQIKPLNGREFSHEYLGKVGDKLEGQIVGEYTFELHNEKAHAKLVGLPQSLNGNGGVEG